MNKDEIRRLVCECLETVGTVPGDCAGDTMIPDLSEAQKQALVGCIITEGDERGCDAFLGTGYIQGGMTVDELVDVVWWSIDCEESE